VGRTADAYDVVGLAIAAFEASSESNAFSSKFDYYLKRQARLTPQELQGLALFRGKGKCVACHVLDAPGRMLAHALYAEMVTPGTVAGGRRTRHGLGVALSDLAGHPSVHHGGDIDGFTTFTAYLPDDSLNITVLINTQGLTRPDAVAAAVVEAALGLHRQRPAGPGPSDLTMFAGRTTTT
jgi:hypothetical protein